MPKFLTTTTGLWPKIGGKAPSLRANLHKFDRREIAAEELELVIQKNIERAVREQLARGIDLPTDGLIRANDLFAPFVEIWAGLTRRGIHRFLDTNTLYGEPVVTDELKFKPSRLGTDFACAQKFGAKKALLPGPFTFAQACVNKFYPNSRELEHAIARNLQREIAALKKAGAEFIELHEPSLALEQFPAERIKAIVQVLEPAGEIIFVSYFRNFSLETAQAILAGGGVLGLDLTAPLNFALSALPPNLARIQLGVINMRETRLETVADLPQDLWRDLKIPEVLLSTNASAEFLPHDRALAKVHLLQDLRVKLSGDEEK